MELFLKLFGILLGVLARTLVPYLRKLRQGKVKEFKNGYWLSALASFILGVITTLLIFPKFEFVGAVAGTEAFIKLFCTAFAFGFAWNSLVSEGAKWAEKPKQKETL
ncbi:MAG: hypothetical protein ACETWK_05595 [Candidatus Aminicenantaceae bacterium]